MTRTIRAVIVDDEPIARRNLRLLLADHPEIELVGESDGSDAAELIVGTRPDLLFLDVQMPDRDGFRLLAEVGVETVPAVVFVTAFDQHALRAFEVDAVDYLLKPFDDERFAVTLKRVKAALALLESAGEMASPSPAAAASAAPPATTPRYLRRLVIPSGGRLVLVAVREVDWIEAADYYAKLHVGERTHLVRQTMGELERALDPAAFFRLHRSTIVNLERIRELVPLFKGEYRVVLQGGATLRMARGRLEELQRRLAT